MAGTVSALVDRLGPAIVTSTTGPVGHTIGDVVVVDPVSPCELERGQLVVACGYAPDGPALQELLEAAQATGVAGVLVKAASPVPPPVGSSADELTILTVAPPIDWGHLMVLLRTATADIASHPEDNLFGLTEALGSLLGGPVVILDAGWQLLAYSGEEPLDAVRQDTILGRRTPQAIVESLRDAGVVASLQRGDVTTVRSDKIAGLHPRWAVAVKVGEEILATIWVQPVRDVDDIESRLRQAAAAASLTLLQASSARSNAPGAGDEAFENLLSGARVEWAVARALGTSVDEGFVLVGMRPTGDARDRVAIARRMRALVRGFAEAYRLNLRVGTGVESAYALLVCSDDDRRSGVMRIVEDLHARLQMSAPHSGIVSRRIPTLADVPEAREVLDQLLLVAHRRQPGALVDAERVEASWRLEQLREIARAHPDLFHGPVAELAAHDAVSGSAYVDTLRAYFDSFGDAAAAAKRLGVHVNSVRYRIRRVEELVGLALDDPDQRLLAELQVRLLT